MSKVMALELGQHNVGIIKYYLRILTILVTLDQGELC